MLLDRTRMEGERNWLLVCCNEKTLCRYSFAPVAKSSYLSGTWAERVCFSLLSHDKPFLHIKTPFPLWIPLMSHVKDLCFVSDLLI